MTKVHIKHKNKKDIEHDKRITTNLKKKGQRQIKN